MSAYRRLNRPARTITFQHPTYSGAYQSTTITNGVNGTDSGSNQSVDLINNSGSKSYDGNGTTCTNSNVSNNTLNTDDRQQLSTLQVTNNNMSTASYPPQPKHIRFPDVPYNSELLNELMMFAYTIIAAAMQFLHLYRTVWWLPESNTSQTMVWK